MHKRLYLLFFIFISAFNFLFGQEKPYIFTADNITLTEALTELSYRYQVSFAFDNQLLSKMIISIDTSSGDLETLIGELLQGTELNFRVIDGVIVVFPKSRGEKKKAIYVSGVVKDKSTGESLPYANIFIKGSNKGTAANNDGFFTLSDIAYSDTVELVADYLGYQKQSFKLSSLKNFENVQVNLEHEARILDVVDIAGGRHETVESGEKVGQFVVNPKNMGLLPNMGEADIFQALKYLPGISVANDNSEGLSVRGSTGDQNLMMLDGYSLYKQDHCFGMFSAVNAYAVKNIRVYRGGYESKYGGRVGGVIDITGKSGNRYKPSGHLGLNMLSANLMVEVPFFKNKGSFFVAGRRSFTDILQTPLYNEIFNSLFADNEMLVLNIGDNQHVYEGEIDPHFFFYDVNAKVTYNPTSRDVVSVSFYTGNDKLGIRDTEYNYFNFISTGNLGVSAKWDRQWNKNYYSEMLIGYSDYTNDFSQSYDYYDSSYMLQTDVLNVFNSIEEFKIKNDNGLILNPRNKLEFGMEADKTRMISTASSGASMDDTEFDQTGNLLIGYIQYSFQPYKILKVIPGVRMNYFDGTERFYVEPRLSIYIYPTEHLTLKASAGKYNQFISRLSVPDQYGGYSYFWMQAGENVPVLSADHYVAGFNYSKGAFSVDVEFYKKVISGLTEFRYAYDTTFSDMDVKYYSGRQIIKGMDIMIKNRFGPFTGWVSYTLSNNTNYFDGLNDGVPFPSDNNKKHEFKIIGLLRVHKWDFSMTWVYSSGMPYSKPDNEAQEFYFSPVHQINAYRLPDFHRLDLSVSYNYTIKKIKGTLGFSVINVYNRKNVKSKLFFLDYKSDVYNYIPVTINYPGFAPSLFITLDF